MLALCAYYEGTVRDDVDNFLPLFEGEVHHVLYEVEDIPVSR
jgi:hypothetical protein